MSFFLLVVGEIEGARAEAEALHLAAVEVPDVFHHAGEAGVVVGRGRSIRRSPIDEVEDAGFPSRVVGVPGIEDAARGLDLGCDLGLEVGGSERKEEGEDEKQVAHGGRGERRESLPAHIEANRGALVVSCEELALGDGEGRPAFAAENLLPPRFGEALVAHPASDEVAGFGE